MSSVPQQQGARQVVASFDTYEEAQRAVDTMSDRKFPVARLSIVGQDLRLVEQVTGRRGYAQAAIQGLLSGAFVGAFIGLLFGLFSLFDPLASALVLAFYGIVIGGIFGLIFGLIGHALTRGRRDFSSVSAMRAGHYDILADAEVADDALRVLQQR